MPLLDGYLEQISLSAKSIGDLDFPQPKIFTNAQLGDHEITTLIRDTEPHERALFSLHPDLAGGVYKRGDAKSNGAFSADVQGYRRKSIYAVTPPVTKSAVARVLGSEMLREIRHSSGNASRSKNGVDIEVLLRGAEKLSGVYTIPGVSEKIIAIRNRHQQIAASVTSYEEKVMRQQSKLSRLNSGMEKDAPDDRSEAGFGEYSQDSAPPLTEKDFEREEAEIRELEARKKALEDRVTGIEKDLGGLLR